MAEDLEKKMEPEISEAADKAAEVIKEEVTAAEEKAAGKVAEAAKETAEATAAAATAVTATAAKEAEAAAKAAKKAEEQAAKEAKKAEEQAAKEVAKRQAQAEKQAEKERLAKEKAEAKLEKKRQKKAAAQALIDACPPQYRPVSTSKYFWLAFLSCVPVIGFIATFILSIAGRNRNVKNFERAILAYYIIAIVIALIGLIVVGICLPSEIRENVIEAIRTMVGSISFG